MSKGTNDSLMEYEYSIRELLERLEQDDSWDPDCDSRKKAVGLLLQKIPSA